MISKLTEVSNTLLKGRLTELKALTYFLEFGYIVSIPEIPCQYDFLLDVKGKIFKIQVKTCREQDGYIEFNTSSMTHNKQGYTRREYTSDMVDFFCTYHNEKCYLVPLSECGSRAKRLRLVPTKNGQTKNICFAENYLATTILENL